MEKTGSLLTDGDELHSANTHSPHRVLELADYIAIIRQHKWVVIVVTLVTVATAAAWSSTWEPRYRSDAEILVEPLQALPGQTGQSFVNLETEARIASSEQVAEIAAEKLGFRGPAASLTGGLTVTPETESSVLTISYYALNPRQARDGAESFAEAYLVFRQRELLERALASQEPIRTAISDKEEAVADLQDGLETSGDPTGDRQQIANLESEIDFLEQQLLTMTPPSTFQVGTIIDPARLPGSPLSTGRFRTIALALIAGIGLGIGIVFLRERLDQSLRSREDLEGYLGAPVLAVIPRVREWKPDDPYLVSLEEKDSPAAEAYRTVRIGLLFAASMSNTSAILFTSAEAGEGKTTTVSNLAVAFAAAGKRVVAVSADLRKPRLEDFFRVRRTPGLTNVLAGELELGEAFAGVRGVPGLRILPSGPIPGNPAELLTSQAMARILTDLRAQADFVLIDTAPLLAVSDGLALAPFVDAVVLSADARSTQRTSIAQARRLLDQVGARILGAVLGNADGVRWGIQARYYQAYGSGGAADVRNVIEHERGPKPTHTR